MISQVCFILQSYVKLYHLYLLNSPKLFHKFTMANADITKYSSIKLDYLFCIIGIKSKFTKIIQAHKSAMKYFCDKKN